MAKTIEEIDKEINHSSKNELMISIDNTGKIIKFNEIIEKISGYSKYESLNKFFLDFIAPNRYLQQWIDVFHSIEENRLIDDFKLPILTRKGHEIMISWSSFPINDDDGNISNISLVGKLVSSWDDSEEFIVDESKFFDRDVNDNEDSFNLYQELENKNGKLEKRIEKLKQSKLSTRLSKLFGGKKNKVEFEDKDRLQQIEERERSLSMLENNLEEEKRSLSEQRNWFVEWRKKLEDLEFEIEKRHKDKIKQENAPVEVKINSTNEGLTADIAEEDSVDEFDEIEDCAAIIQRGIIKKINDSFADLLGYTTDEILDKSLFDFIGPEGFSNLEDYYLHRLKGEGISFYNTIFLTKDNDKISVEVSTQPTFFNNDKAEIAVIKKIDKKQKN